MIQILTLLAVAIPLLLGHPFLKSEMMKVFSLFVLIAVQVICFQFLMHSLRRMLPDQLLGRRGHPPGIARQIEDFRQGQGRQARAIGVLLLLAAIIIAFAPILQDPGSRKLGLAGVSLLSSLVMLLGYIGDTRRVLAIGGQLPKSGTRSAGLAPRGIASIYHPALELLPPLLFLATLFWAIGRGADIFSAPLIALLLCQLGFVAASHFVARWLVAQGPAILPDAMALQDGGSDAIAESSRLRYQDLRSFLAARVLIVILLGVMLAQQIAESKGEAMPYWLAMGDRILVVLLLVSFAAQLLQLSRWQKGFRSPKREAGTD